MRMRLVTAAAVLVAFGAPLTTGAQIGSFGQNKIQYRDFDWHVLKGEHVDVYFYPAEERIARVALSYAEESYDYLARRLNHEVSARIPLIVYASHSDFEQTNILPFVPPEGILGVTEFLKRRVAMPFRGSYSEFRHTLRHEMVHVFQLSLLAQQFELYPRARRTGLPLWYSEGLAEYLSSEQETRDNMVVRDLMLNGRMPTIQQLGGVYSPLVYPVGAELHHFLARRYGDWRIPLMYASLSAHESFERAMRDVYGKTMQQLTEEWHYELRQRYFPAVAGRRPFGVAGRQIATLALKPAPVLRRDGSVDVAYLSPRSGYTNIYRKPLGGGRAKVVVAGERTPEFESLHAFSSRIDARDGVLLFASKYQDRDALFFWNLDRNRVVGRYQFDSLVSILSPAWSPDGRKVAFSALSNGGVSDLFVLDLKTQELVRVTDDVYEDVDPTWLPDGASLVFSSDRARGGEEGSRNLYRVSLHSREILPITSGRWADESPRWDSERGRILFTSDRDGTFNLYSVDTLGNGQRETRLDGGIFDPAPIPNDPRVLVGGFNNLSWSVFALVPDTAIRTDTFALAQSDTGSAWGWSELADSSVAQVRAQPYKRRFSLDFAAGGGEYAPGWGAQGAQFFFSDLLGDHALAVSVAMYQGNGIGDMLANLNGNVFYLNQRRRLNWGVGAFRLAGTFYERGYTQLYRETTGGVYGALRYPLSRFMRVEGQTRLEYSNRNDFANDLVEGPRRREGVLVSNFLGLVGDNTLWLDTGPIDGMRWNLTGGVVSDVSHGVFENWVGAADVRKYFRTSQQSAYAVRGLVYASEGVRPRAISIGGSWMLRGYPPFSGINGVDGTRVWLLNNEWRFPITNFVTVGFPFGSVRFPQVQGAFFTDAAQAWEKDQFDRAILGSAGVGFRTALIPGLVFRLDVGRRFRYLASDDAPPAFPPGRFVDFFFGYNY